MREILYRGFHPCENGTEKVLIDGKWIKGEWVYGYYVRYGWTHQEKDYIVPSYASDLYAKEVIPETIGQYTGLTDKNSKKIFEGDIVEGHCHSQWSHQLIKCVVVYNRDSFKSRHYLNYPNDKHYFEYKVLFSKDVVVIGNIHDNLELMQDVN